jgi:hypothetical protein
MPLEIDLSFKQKPVGQLVVVYGVQTDAPQAFPAIWQVHSSIALQTQLVVPWNDQLAAYYSDTKCIAGTTVGSFSPTQCRLGQTFQLDANQTASVQAEGPQGQLSIANSSADGWTFGCCLDNGNGLVPHFACALGANDLIQAIPGPCLLLYFVTGTVEIGQLIGPSPYRQQRQAALPYSPILCLDLREFSQSSRAAMQYDSSAGGWQLPSPAPTWASIYPATQDIPTLAVQPLPG